MGRFHTTLAKALVCASVALAGTSWADVLYLHDGGVMDPYPPTSTNPTTRTLNAAGQTISWLIPVPAGFDLPNGSYTWRYYGSGTAGTINVSRLIGLAATTDCSQLTCSNSQGPQPLNDGIDGGTLPWSYGSSCSLMGPPGYFCFTITVSGVAGGGITLRYDSPSAPAYSIIPGDAGLGLDAGGGVDAGADAGTDAGTDAGVDAGTSADAGNDGGGSGGGPPGDAGGDGGDVAGVYAVGCDCSATGAGVIPLVLFAAALRGRRRHPLAARPR